MLELYKLIYSKLNELPFEVYNEYVPYCSILPCIVFKMANLSDVENTREDAEVIIDVWDKCTDVVRIEYISDLIDKMLNRLHFNNEKISTNIYRLNPYLLNIPDPDMKIKHRQLRYTAKFYEKEVI